MAERKKERKGAVAEMTGNRPEDTELTADGGDALPEEDSRASRTEKREEGRTRRKKRVILLFAAFLATAAAAVAILNWSSVRDASGWVADKVSGIWEEKDVEDAAGQEAFLMNPLTGQEIKDETINTLVCIDNDMILALVLVSLGGDGSARFYLLPEDITGRAQDGSDLALSQSLAANPERPAELRHIAESLTGQTVHYVIVLPLKGLPPLVDEMGFPPISVSGDARVYNLFTGNWEPMTAGQVIKDADRILSYLVALGDPDEYAERDKRYRDYLADLLAAINAWSESDISEMLIDGEGIFILSPPTSGAEEDAEYVGSLMHAWAEAGAIGCSFFSVPEIEILNGCGAVGAGSGMTLRLESRGFKVAESGKNAKIVVDGQEINDFSHQTSVIRYSSSDPLAEAYARYIAMLFKIPQVEFDEEGRGITIIVGNDLALTSP